MNRGDRREAIFRDDSDRRRFLKALGEACTRTGWRVHAYVLMTNHYHLLIETPQANLVKGMHWFQTCYTVRFNARHQLSGHVFQGRYKAIPVEPHRDYLFPLADYIHLNPARAGMRVERGGPLEYPWSSLPADADPAKRPAWMECGSILGEMGDADVPGTSRAYAEHVSRRWREDASANDPTVEDAAPSLSGWFVGSRKFGQRLLERLKKRAAKPEHQGKRHGGGYGEAMAEQIVLAGLKEFKMKDALLATTAKSDWRKRIIGHRIRQQTSVSLRWISDRLRMGAIPRVSMLCAHVNDLQSKLKKVKK